MVGDKNPASYNSIIVEALGVVSMCVRLQGAGAGTKKGLRGLQSGTVDSYYSGFNVRLNKRQNFVGHHYCCLLRLLPPWEKAKEHTACRAAAAAG